MGSLCPPMTNTNFAVDSTHIIYFVESLTEQLFWQDDISKHVVHVFSLKKGIACLSLIVSD